MGLRIKKLRQARGLSAERLAQRASISTKTVNRAERTDNATAKTLKAIAMALEVSVGDLFEEGAA